MTDEPIDAPSQGGDGEDWQAIMARRFQETPLHDLLGLAVTQADPDLVVVTMPVREQAFNAGGNLHGGAIATLIDVAAGLACALNSPFRPGENTIVTADLHVRYLGRPIGAEVRAEAQVMRAGRQLVIAECRVLDGEGKMIAFSDFSSMIVPLREPMRPTPQEIPGSPDL